MIKVVLHPEKITYMMTIGAIARASERAAGKVRDRGKHYVSVDTGTLRNSITAERVPAGPRHIHWRIGTPVAYARPQEVGTGPIYARRAPLLVFKVGNQWVSTYSTRGVPAQRYLTRAITETTMEDFL
jgi:hypothetical protein